MRVSTRLHYEDGELATGRRTTATQGAGSPPRLHAAALLLAAFALLGGLIAAPRALAAPNDTVLVSRASGVDGATGNGDSGGASISVDGRFVAFASCARNLHPAATVFCGDRLIPSTYQIFVRDLQENTTILVSRASGADGASAAEGSHSQSISADGRFVAFDSEATNLHPDATDEFVEDVFVRDLEENTTTLVSRASGADGAKGNKGSHSPSVSADGRFVAFASGATNLHSDATDGKSNVFVRDLQQNTTTLATPASAAGRGPSISADGRFVAFSSPLHPDDYFLSDVFVRDLEENTTTLVSTGATGAQSNRSATGPSISADGRFVAFSSQPAVTLVTDIFVRDLQKNTTTLASRASGAEGAKANEPSGGVTAADGRFVAFESQATNLHPDATDFGPRIFVRDLEENITTLASRASGACGAVDDRGAGGPSISADGRFVAFSSLSNLHSDASDRFNDVFRRELSLRHELELNRPAKLEIERARVRNRRLVVRGSLGPTAAGERLAVSFRARGRQVRLRPTVGEHGEFGVKRALRGPQRPARAGRLVVRFSGNETLRAASVRLRAARRAVRLRIGRARLQGKRLAVAGRVAPRARGRVRIAIEFNRASCAPGQITMRTGVNERGRFRLGREVPPTVRNLGARVSVIHPGRGRLHGQRLGRQVGG